MKFIDYIFPTSAPLYPGTLDGKPIQRISPEIEIRDRKTIIHFYRKGYRRFIFRPFDAGLVGIDCDRKNGKDGVKELLNIIGTEPDFFTITPSGGRHYYFFNNNRMDYVSAEIIPGLEIKSRAFITIPGSRSRKGKYVQHGTTQDIKPLPDTLAAIIPVRNPNPAPIPQPIGDNLKLDRINDILNRQGLTPDPGQRNHYTFQFARFARKQGHGPEAVQTYLSFIVCQDFPSFELQAAVKSAYRGRA